jgi:hypothetical membrane protein
VTRAALALGAAVPLLYFGTQLAAAPAHPGYDFVRQAASELGSPASRAPWVFNTGAVLTGLATLAAAYGFLRALPRVGSPAVATVLLVLALVAAGMAGIQAGIFPLPDPRHNPGWLGMGLFALLPLLALAFLRAPRAGALRLFLLASALLFLVQFPLRAGIGGFEPRESAGLLQRLLALAVYPPIGVASLFLGRRIGSSRGDETRPA